MSFVRPEEMEVGCVRPGLWLVEGRTVERVRPNRWQVYEDGKFVGWEPTLTEACELIYARQTVETEGTRGL